MTQGTQNLCSVTTLRDVVGWRWEGSSEWRGTHVYVWLIHIDVWYKPSQYYKVVILQLK